jgi:transposase
MVRLEEFMEISHLSQAGYSISAISRLTGRDRKTVKKYIQRNHQQPLKMRSRPKRPSKLKNFEADILNYINLAETQEYPPCTAIYEKLVQKGYQGSLSLLQKWVKRYREKIYAKVALRFETLPGKQAQVDWGEKKVFDKQAGRYKRVYIFCMTLSYSRMRFVHFTPRADMYHFLVCHQEAFRYFGGVTEEILYDQNRCVVIKPRLKDPVYNQQFLDFAHHYDFMPRVCRPYRPQTKGKVENTIKYVKRNFLSLQDTSDTLVLNQRKREWLQRINNKVHSTTQEIPTLRLKREKLNAIQEIAEYPVYCTETRKVFNDSTFSFQGRRFSVTVDCIGKMVTVKYRPGMSRIDVFYKERFITQHRTDSGEFYVIKRIHRQQIWQVWREDKRLFYHRGSNIQPANHPLKVYEQISAEEAGHATAHVR